MNNSYLIPANSKKSMLMFGIFNTIDFWVFGVGLGISFLMLMFLPVQQFWVAMLAISPGLISGFLVFPIPNYHNVRTFIRIAFEFYTTRQHFVWRGWCFNSGKFDDEK